ncbi:undecaprenyl pyrophosphate synthase [Corynebacterium glutamicum ZL-6]|uniref:isoprenyl transferase n=1 Tax=Corynebacterium TaxID=1716 RepID=UPI0008074ABC|nr:MULTISPECIES: isoprenyl transferase [Corynebacterium]ANR62064.1 undecaprenyl pyrophosphate synthase [[Brevibacterium] flavum ZL-1]ANR65064.1 undecaprenyl pyrophosphate synthase [Corynebacterium glutamicum ZL-6]PST76498.1 undecaprenyl pyrophosphate synthase [Corynebacterium glutamicum ZL-2]
MLNLPRLLYPVYERRLLRELDGAKQPGHVAIMCDGNRRWAREAGFTDVSHGHRVGAKKIGEMVRWCDDVDVNLVTVYLLSMENLGRSSEELQLLFDIIADVADELARPETNCRVRLVGHLDLLPDPVACRLRKAEEATVNNTGIAVNMAVGYGGRQEIVDAVQKLLTIGKDEGLSVDELIESVKVDAISTHLYTSGQPDPDLVIRTSGEQRLSGFMLWQSAYSEIWFTDTYWPAFRRIDFLRAIRDYSQRSRRFDK